TLFATLTTAHPDARALRYPYAAALAASGRADEARAALDGGGALAASEIANRLLAGARAASPAARAEVTRRVAAVLAEPADARARAALGRRLIELGAVRAGAAELSAACGIAGRGENLVSLADAYARLGAL